MGIPLLDMICCCSFLNKKREKKEKEITSQESIFKPVPEVRDGQRISQDRQSQAVSIKPSSRASSDDEFFDANSDFSNPYTTTGQEIFRSLNDPDGLEPHSEAVNASSVWDYFSWAFPKRSIFKRSFREKEAKETAEEFQEISVVDTYRRTASASTLDIGQKGVLEKFSNLVHSNRRRSESFVPQKLASGTTFERMNSSVSFADAREKWEPTDPTKYKIRSKNYIKTKIKEACKGAFYDVIDCDLISFDKKQTHVAKMIQLPEDPYSRTPEELNAISKAGMPILLVVNMQIPVYQPSLFGACDGPGHSFVFYCFLQEHFNPETFSNRAALGLFLRFVKECRNQSAYRIKLIPKFLNVEEWAEKGPLTQTEHRLVNQFNEKPILTRPYQQFFHESGYFEIDLDVHSWLYVARKALWTLTPRMNEVVTEVAMLIQGNNAEDLPEHLVAVARVYRVDLSRLRRLSDILENQTRPTSSKSITDSVPVVKQD